KGMSLVLLVGAIGSGAFVLAQQSAPPPTPRTTPTSTATSRFIVPDTPQVVYELRLLEMKGLAWRARLSQRLTLVKHELPFTVWTTDLETYNKIAAMAANVLQAPKITAFAGGTAQVFQQDRQRFEVGVKPLPMNDTKEPQKEVEWEDVEV